MLRFRQLDIYNRETALSHLYCQTLVQKTTLCTNQIPLCSKTQLDWGSKRSSPRDGLSTPYRLTIRNSARLFLIVLFNMGDLHLVLPALSLSTLNAGILIKMHQVRLMMFSLNMVDYSMSFFLLFQLNFFYRQVGGTIVRHSYSLSVVV